ncbi:terpene synthase family protein [Filimonas effusa]|uniref:Terpene synthase n=1 Tax=Filimonas effusa TaxID=2508721 RepID=A0A4V1M9M1_9BACT|nr:terpene synthase family protein [Filimonas effusa]RXK81690.1 hypothetical protein ESB13_18000 [Filimonas effusa]
MFDIALFPPPSYPFEPMMSNWCDQVIEDTSNWLQNDYGFLPPKMQEKYQRSNFGKISARCLPKMNSYRHLQVAAKFMLWGTIFDDYYEFAKIDELKCLLLKVKGILDGNSELALDNPLLCILCNIQRDLKELMSDSWINIFTSNVCVWIESMQEETFFKSFDNFPSIDYFYDLRTRTIGVQSYLDLIVMQLPTELPIEVMNSPYFRELYHLSARIFSWCNDFFSLPKDFNREPLNIVYVLQNEYKLDIASAYRMAMKIHDDDVRKFCELADAKPDFGKWQQSVSFFVRLLKTMFRGQNDWYLYDTLRYRMDISQNLDLK